MGERETAETPAPNYVTMRSTIIGYVMRSFVTGRAGQGRAFVLVVGPTPDLMQSVVAM